MAKVYISPKNVVADKTYMVNGVPLYQYFIYDHNINNMRLPAKRSKKIIGVTIHNTDDLENVQDDGRQYTAATCNDNMRDVFVNAYVDELGAWWNFDWTYENWSCKDGRGNGNTATIAIECIMDGQTGVNNEKAMDNTARLAAWLLYKYGLTANDLYTHTHWLNVVDGVKGDRDYLNTKSNPYKTCPYYIIPQWSEFKKLVDKYIVKLGGKSIYQTSTPTATTISTNKTYSVPSGITFATATTKNVITTYSYKSHKDKKLSNHFQVKEFASWKVKNKTLYSDKVKIHNKLIQILEIVYAELDCSKIIINSGYRTSKHDKAVGGSGNGQHTLGRACDFTAYDKNGKIIDAKKICCLLEDMGVWGIGYISPTSVHVDTRLKSKQWWGDETKAGSPNISKLGYKSFHDYFNM